MPAAIAPRAYCCALQLAPALRLACRLAALPFYFQIMLEKLASCRPSCMIPFWHEGNACPCMLLTEVSWLARIELTEVLRLAHNILHESAEDGCWTRCCSVRQVAKDRRAQIVRQQMPPAWQAIRKTSVDNCIAQSGVRICYTTGAAMGGHTLCSAQPVRPTACHDAYPARA